MRHPLSWSHQGETPSAVDRDGERKTPETSTIAFQFRERLFQACLTVSHRVSEWSRSRQGSSLDAFGLIVSLLLQPT